jgi:hypothetical protein
VLFRIAAVRQFANLLPIAPRATVLGNTGSNCCAAV